MILAETKDKAGYNSSSYLNGLVANIDDAIISTNLNFIITGWNRSAERIYGIEAEQAIGAHRNQVLQHDYLDSSFIEIVNDLMMTGRWKGLLKFTRKDGKEIYLLSSATTIKNEADERIGYVAINRDVTEEYIAQQSLLHFTAIMHCLNESFLIVTRNMEVVFLSPKKNVQEFHGSDYKVGDHALKFIPEKDMEEVTANYKKTFKGEQITHEADSGGDEKTRIYLQVTYLPIKNTFDYTTHVAVIIKDLTDERRMERILQKQKQMEKELFHARALFENFMQNCPLPAWVTDEKGVMQYMNPTYFSVTGFGKKDIGKTMHQLFPKENAEVYDKHNAEVLQTKKSITVTEQAFNPHGKLVTYLNSKFPLHYLGKKMVGGWAIDISAQTNSQLELEKANSFKTKLLSVISHDLRSPLTSISALTSLVSDDDSPFTREDLLEFFTLVQSANHRTLTLLDELRTWGQCAMSRLSHQPKELDLEELIPSAVDFLKGTLADKNIHVLFCLQPQLTVWADADMLKTIIRNLVSNAIKFSPPQSCITLSAHTGTNKITISITDEGTGIEDEIKQKILQGNNDISTYGTNGEKGIGLGLAICKDFIEANGGVMTLQNNPAKGCTFSFTVPVRQA